MWDGLLTPGSPVEPSRGLDHRPAVRLLLCLAGGLCVATLAVLLQLALARPAGAAPQQPGVGLLAGPSSIVNAPPVAPVVAAVGQTVDATPGTVGQATTAVVQAAGSAVQSIAAPALGAAAAPVVQPVTQVIHTATGLLGATTPSLPLPISTPAGPVGRVLGPLAPTSGSDGSTAAVVGHPVPGSTHPPTLPGPTSAASPLAPSDLHPVGSIGRTFDQVFGSTGSQLRSFSSIAPVRAPGRSPLPRHAPPLAPSPAVATTDTSSPAHGSSPLDALPPMGLLLPALIAFGVLLGRHRNPRLRFDLRFAPPG
jgi:hypothetical protein